MDQGRSLVKIFTNLQKSKLRLTLNNKNFNRLFCAININFVVFMLRSIYYTAIKFIKIKFSKIIQKICEKFA